jgi:hypothetical protein
VFAGAVADGSATVEAIAGVEEVGEHAPSSKTPTTNKERFLINPMTKYLNSYHFFRGYFRHDISSHQHNRKRA